jgi:hypothetical protein
LEGAEEAGVDVHERAGVVELAAVVGRGEYGDELPVREELVAVLYDLSRSVCQIVNAKLVD